MTLPICKKCGYQNKEGNKYCVNCAYPLEGTPEEVKLRPTTTQITSAHILAGILIFIVLAGIIYFLMPKVVTFTIQIESNTSWAGSIGADGSSRTIQGSGSQSFQVTGTIAVAVIQKQTEYGYLTVSILRDGRVLDRQTTTAAYGVVSVSASG